jgi:hypothetical protein
VQKDERERAYRRMTMRDRETETDRARARKSEQAREREKEREKKSLGEQSIHDGVMPIKRRGVQGCPACGCGRIHTDR